MQLSLNYEVVVTVVEVSNKNMIKCIESELCEFTFYFNQACL